jgi:hypothetical protein
MLVVAAEAGLFFETDQFHQMFRHNGSKFWKTVNGQAVQR